MPVGVKMLEIGQSATYHLSSLITRIWWMLRD